MFNLSANKIKTSKKIILLDFLKINQKFYLVCFKCGVHLPNIPSMLVPTIKRYCIKGVLINIIGFIYNIWYFSFVLNGIAECICILKKTYLEKYIYSAQCLL